MLFQRAKAGIIDKGNTGASTSPQTSVLLLHQPHNPWGSRLCHDAKRASPWNQMISRICNTSL